MICWCFFVTVLRKILSYQLLGQIISTVKEACRKAFQNQSQRLVTPMYACNIVCSADVLGKLIFFFICKISFLDFSENS